MLGPSSNRSMWRTFSGRALVPTGPLLAALLPFAFVNGAEPAIGQELEPRVYSASPIDTNFVVGSFTNSTGNVSLDPTLPLTDAHSQTNTTSLSFTHTFPLAGRTATWAIAVPYLAGLISASGGADDRTAAVDRHGFADLRFRFSVDLLSRALKPAEFARRAPHATLGVGVTVVAPTGAYDPTQLINIGSNRWSVKPEIGIEVPIGKWFADFAAGLWLFGENANYAGTRSFREAPLATYQVHAGYSFRPGQWLAIDGGYIAGGATTLGAGAPLNASSNSRYGAAFSQPLGPGISAKAAWSHWLRGPGQEYSSIGAALQYRWFNRP
jgi:hypothetical protein